MTKQKHGKDCLQTVLSDGLGIDYDLIPRFYENDETWHDQYNKWLKSHNLFRILIDMEYNKELKFPYCSVMPILIIGILHIKPREHEHAVILQLTKTDIIMHDPKIDSDYDLTDLVQIEMIFKGVQ